MGRWAKVHAGFYERIASDGATVIANVVREDNGRWAYTVRPFGRVQLGWQVTGKQTMTEAQRGAEAGYRRYMDDHRTMNTK